MFIFCSLSFFSFTKNGERVLSFVYSLFFLLTLAASWRRLGLDGKKILPEGCSCIVCLFTLWTLVNFPRPLSVSWFIKGVVVWRQASESVSFFLWRLGRLDLIDRWSCLTKLGLLSEMIGVGMRFPSHKGKFCLWRLLSWMPVGRLRVRSNGRSYRLIARVGLWLASDVRSTDWPGVNDRSIGSLPSELALTLPQSSGDLLNR
jgi:hypothetical protein